jgi:hypothetical protein
MYALYKVEVWIKADIDQNTPLEYVLQNIDNIPSGKVNFIEDENYQTSTESFIPAKDEATFKLFSSDGKLIYTNKKEGKNEI